MKFLITLVPINMGEMCFIMGINWQSSVGL